MRPLSFLIPAAALLLAACGGPSEPPTPEQSLADAVEEFHSAAVTFARQVGEEFADNAIDPAALHRSAGFANLLAASLKFKPDFPIAAEAREPLAYFALCLGHPDKPLEWDVRLHPDPAAEDRAIASVHLPADEYNSPAFFVRVARDKKKGWQLASWPPLTRDDFQQLPEGAARLILRFTPAGSELAGGAAFSQIEWHGQALYHSLFQSEPGSDAWSRLEETLRDAILPAAETNAAGQPAEPLYLLADPAVPASLLLGLLEVLARPAVRWSSVQVGLPGEALDRYFLLEQDLAWESVPQHPIVNAGGSEEEWSAALAGAGAGAAVGLRLDPALTLGVVVAEIERLQKRGAARVFIALPLK